MTDLNSYGYDSETKGFWSHTEQINWHIDRFRDRNEAALDRNTEFLIKEYSRKHHRGQSRHTQQETGYIAAFTTL